MTRLRAQPGQSPTDFWPRIRPAARASGSRKHPRDTWRGAPRMPGRCRVCAVICTPLTSSQRPK
eukprot:6144126-Pyramimonas_sp.AAC.1